MNKNKNEPVDFSPAGAADYKARIEAAKAGSTPVGGAPMPKMPRLNEPPPGATHKPMTHEEYNRALASGQIVPGVGAAYAANQPPASDQPEMAVSRDDAPVNPPRAERGLRPETAAQLEAIAQANAEKDEAEESTDDEYFEKLGQATEDIINNEERRKAIEAKITDDLSFEDLIENQEVRQKVPIRKGFVPEYRSAGAAEDLFVKRLIGAEEGRGPRYVLDKYSVMNLTLGLFSLNGRPLPDHRDTKDLKPNEDLFWKKFDIITRYPLVVVADLCANYDWFQRRVQKLLSLEQVKSF